MTVDVVFSFDSEDYETPAADEGERWWAGALSRHGMTGCFCIVGELARAVATRSPDILDAWRRHEVGFHSDMHSMHPLHAEYLEEMGWEDGVAAVLAREARGVADVRRLLGQQPIAYCKPGSSWAPQVPAAMSLLDVPVFCDAPVEWATGRPLWYCGALCIKYHTAFDRYFSGADRQRRMRDDFLALIDQRQPGGVLVMYTHPCRLITSAWTETFRGGINRPRSAWQSAPLRPRGEVEELMGEFDAFLGWVAQQQNVNVTTYRALHARYHDRSRWLDRAGIEQLLREAMGPLQPRLVSAQWLSPAEQLGVLLEAAAWQHALGHLPDIVPIRPLLGPDMLAAPSAPREIETTALLDVAAAINAETGRRGRVPAGTEVGRQVLGPGALLHALAQALQGAPERVTIGPSVDVPELAARADFADLRFRGGWSMFAPEFEAPHVLQMARLQTWSARPAG